MQNHVAMISQCLTLVLWGWFNNLVEQFNEIAFTFNGTIACMNGPSETYLINGVPQELYLWGGGTPPFIRFDWDFKNHLSKVKDIPVLNNPQSP